MSLVDMYLDQGEPSEKCGEIHFGLEYDFGTQTLKLKIIQVNRNCKMSSHFAIFPSRARVNLCGQIKPRSVNKKMGDLGEINQTKMGPH